MPLPSNTDSDSPRARRDRVLTGFLISGPAAWFITYLFAYALSAHACNNAVWTALLLLLGGSSMCSVLALRACVRRLQAERGIADLTLHSFVMISGVMLNSFSLLLTLGLCAALFTGSRCD